MDKIIIDILANYARPLRNVISIHSKNYRYLLPDSVNKFHRYKKYRHNEKSYDLYGWNNDILIDVYPTYKNIITKEDLPKSWIDYIHLIKEVTNVKKMIILIFNKKYNKFINVIHLNDDNIVLNKKVEHQVTKQWIKATGLKNYIMEDTIIDILNKNNQEKNINQEKNQVKNINQGNEDEEMLAERLTMGVEFERDIIDLLIKKYYLDFVKICESYEARNINKYKDTLIEMQKGTPIIHQAVLHDPRSNIFGCVDLLVRSDWIEKIFNQKYENINSMPHYVVIDIKFHRLQLNTDGKTIRNEGMIRVFKSQLYVYNKALGFMQDYEPTDAFVLGRGWIKTYTEKGVQIIEKNNNPFDKLGIIQFRNNDNDIVTKSEEGIKWLNELNTHIFNETSPKYDHNYPNMNNQFDMGHKKRKRSIAEDNNELTLLSYVGVKQRKTALYHGINNFLDRNLTCEKLGITGEKEKIVNALIQNQQELDKPIKGKYECPSIKDVEVFLDFEYMYSYEEDENIPYLCGIGYVNNNQNINQENTDTIDTIDTIDTKSWNFFYILLDDISIVSRESMCKNIMEILEKIKATHIYTWSEVDRRLLTNECKKYNLSDKLNGINWIDMYKFCLTNHINFKGAKGYGLKEVGRVLYLNNLTDVTWENNLSSSSTVSSRKHYYKNIKWNPSSIIRYNEIDCKMIYEILLNLRKFQT